MPIDYISGYGISSFVPAPTIGIPPFSQIHVPGRCLVIYHVSLLQSAGPRTVLGITDTLNLTYTQLFHHDNPNSELWFAFYTGPDALETVFPVLSGSGTAYHLLGYYTGVQSVLAGPVITGGGDISSVVFESLKNSDSRVFAGHTINGDESGGSIITELAGRVRLEEIPESPGTPLGGAIADGGISGYNTSALQWPKPGNWLVLGAELTALPPPPPPPPPPGQFVTNAGKESSVQVTDDYGVPFKPPFAQG